MIVTDASVWVSHLIAQEIHHAASREWLTAVVRSGTLIAAPALLLAEVGGAIARRTGDEKLGHQAVNHILSTPNLRLVYTDAELGNLAAKLAVEQKLRGADALYTAVALRLKIPLVSWDQEQIARAAAIVTAYQPG
ncbi:MAG: type II toxin-antitoxin system VapC family toxin [Chloroflexota bacterium]